MLRVCQRVLLPPQLALVTLALIVTLFATGVAYLVALARAFREDHKQT